MKAVRIAQLHGRRPPQPAIEVVPAQDAGGGHEVPAVEQRARSRELRVDLAHSVEPVVVLLHLVEPVGLDLFHGDDEVGIGAVERAEDVAAEYGVGVEDQQTPPGEAEEKLDLSEAPAARLRQRVRRGYAPGPLDLVGAEAPVPRVLHQRDRDLRRPVAHARHRDAGEPHVPCRAQDADGLDALHGAARMIRWDAVPRGPRSPRTTS